MSSLLSSILLSYMEALNREIVNTNLFIFNSAFYNLIEINNILENVNMDIPREWSIVLSPNLIRESSAH